jgi:hypothetical protein
MSLNTPLDREPIEKALDGGLSVGAHAGDTKMLTNENCREYVAELKSNGARFVIRDVDNENRTITLQGWTGRDTLTLSDFAIRYELVRVIS